MIEGIASHKFNSRCFKKQIPTKTVVSWQLQSHRILRLGTGFLIQKRPAIALQTEIEKQSTSKLKTNSFKNYVTK